MCVGKIKEKESAPTLACYLYFAAAAAALFTTLLICETEEGFASSTAQKTLNPSRQHPECCAGYDLCMLKRMSS